MRRGGADYSLGHQAMIRAVAALLRPPEGQPPRWSVLDVGMGMGYGLRWLAAAGCLRRYVGIEPDPACVPFVENEVVPGVAHGVRDGITIIHGAWPACREQLGEARFDHTLCIETIEHVGRMDHYRFLKAMREVTECAGNLFLSTPDVERHCGHGMLSEREVLQALREAEWMAVTPVRSQWTTWYCCGAA